uniref:G-protein coupled receptors family 1 profile domain-containing protein n=1 Tax=Equus caballus TaxID=9796 RepID=A0A3Q2HE62_HORSE
MGTAIPTGGFLSTHLTISAWGTEFTPVNGRDQAPPQTFNMETLIRALLIVIITLVGLPRNTVDCLLYLRCNLAAVSFLFHCCQITHSLGELFTSFHSISISLPSFFTTVVNFAHIADLSLLSIISTEHRLSTLSPLWYLCHHGRHMSSVMCALLWALSLLLNVLGGNYCGFLSRDSYELNHYATWLAPLLIFLLVLLSGSSLALLVRILCCSRQTQLTRLCVVILLTVLVFLLCGLPFGFNGFCWIQKDSNMFSCYLGRTGVILPGIKSSANPSISSFVGSFRHQRLQRQTLRLVLQGALEDTTEVKKSGGSFPQEPRVMSGSSFMR